MRRTILGWIVLIGSVVCGVYVGGWLMFVKPIIEACEAFDAGTLTGVAVGITIMKCICSGAVGSYIMYIGSAIAMRLFKSAK